MTGALSNELRKRVVAAVWVVKAVDRFASRFGVSVSSVGEVVAALSENWLGRAWPDGRTPQAVCSSRIEPSSWKGSGRRPI